QPARYSRSCYGRRGRVSCVRQRHRPLGVDFAPQQMSMKVIFQRTVFSILIALTVLLFCAMLFRPQTVVAQTYDPSKDNGFGYTPNAGGFVPLAEVSGSSKLGELYRDTGTGDFSNFINNLFRFALVIGALAAVLRLVYAGYLYMGQADMWSHKGQAKTIIGDVTLGILLLLGIYLILYQINPDIVKLNALRKIQSSPATTPNSSAGITTGPTTIGG